MNKAQLVDELSARFEGNRRQASNALEAVIDTITRTVAKGEKVAITGFGVFEKIERPARLARNPLTGEKVRVKKTSVPRFKPGAGFKDVVSGAKKLPKLAESARESARKTAESARDSARKAAERLPGRAPAKKAPAKAPAKSTAAKSTAAKAAPAKSTAVKAAAAKKTTAKKTTAKKAAPAKKATTAKKTTAKKTAAKK